jgi:hypothetical protein
MLDFTCFRNIHLGFQMALMRKSRGLKYGLGIVVAISIGPRSPIKFEGTVLFSQPFSEHTAVHMATGL